MINPDEAEGDSVEPTAGSRRLDDGDTLFLKRRFTGAFSALVSPRKNDTRIYVGDLEHKLYEHTQSDWDAKLKRYLRYGSDAGGRPNMESAWAIGEVLRRDFGVKWSTGFWMLYAAGRLEDFLGVLARFVDYSVNMPAKDNHREMQDFWVLLHEIEWLTVSTQYDIDPAFASVHLGYSSCDDFATLLSSTTRRDERRAVDDLSGWKATLKVREAAKKRWLQIEAYIPRLERAYEEWKITRKGMRQSWLMDGALAVARSSDFSPQSKEWVAFKIVEAAMLWWLDSDDVFEVPAFDGEPPPRFWRQIWLRGIW